MSRLNLKYTEEVIHPEERVKKVVLWDFDSVVHQCLYSGKNEETGEKNPEYTENDLEYLKTKLNERFFKIINLVEEKYEIEKLYCFIKGSGNFRKELYSEYKANRPTPSSLISLLYDYAIKEFNCIPSDGYEAEDYVNTLAISLNYDCIVLYVDHDLLELPTLFLNYSTLEWKKLSEKEALYNKYKKLILSEPGDNVQLTKGIGLVYFQKNFNIDMTIEEYEEASLNAFIKAWRDFTIVKKKKNYTENVEKAKEMLILAKKLIWLQNINK